MCDNGKWHPVGFTSKGLDAAKRNALPGKDFAGPDRSFPVNDMSHAKNALARVANRSESLKAAVRAKVHAKYPDIKQHDEGRSPRDE